tara:strand:+ start:1827 stop:2786 length:960 start_codon:yes stop_codon:yes gene_type:complete
MLKKNSKIFVAGHNGLVGSSVVNLLKNKNYKKILTASRKKLDLRNQKKVDLFFKKKKPEILIICAAKVGGIIENKSKPLEFLIDNFQIQKNLLLASKKYNIKRTIFLGSSCIYPKKSKIPIKEEYLLTGKLEKTNEAYALSKIAGLKLCSILHEDYKKDIICLMPTNVYGLNDNFDIRSSHVIPGLISKFINAKKNGTNVQIWGSGKPIREFIHADDLANAILVSLKSSKKKLNRIFKKSLPIMNVGSGDHVSIKRLVTEIKKLTNFEGKIIYNKKFPDGTLNKNLDSTLIKKLKWKTKIKFLSGLKELVDKKSSQVGN